MGTLVLTPFDWYLIGYIAAATLHDKPDFPDNTRCRLAMALGAADHHRGAPIDTENGVNARINSNVGPEGA